MFTTKCYLLLTAKIVHRCWIMPPNIYLIAPPIAFLPFLDCILYIIHQSLLPVTFGEIVQLITTRYPLREQSVEIVQYFMSTRRI